MKAILTMTVVDLMELVKVWQLLIGIGFYYFVYGIIAAIIYNKME